MNYVFIGFWIFFKLRIQKLGKVIVYNDLGTWIRHPYFQFYDYLICLYAGPLSPNNSTLCFFHHIKNYTIPHRIIQLISLKYKIFLDRIQFNNNNKLKVSINYNCAPSASIGLFILVHRGSDSY